MTSSKLLFAAILGIGLSSTAFAQTTVPGTSTTGVPGAPGSGAITPGAGVPGQPGTPVGAAGDVLAPGTAPVGTAPTTIYAPGATAPGTPGTMVPGGAAGTLQGTAPAGTMTAPRTAPARSVRRAGSGAGTTAPMRP
jgi:hypothetical protein